MVHLWKIIILGSFCLPLLHGFLGWNRLQDLWQALWPLNYLTSLFICTGINDLSDVWFTNSFPFLLTLFDRVLWYKSNFNFDVTYFLCCWYHQMSYIALCKDYIKSLWSIFEIIVYYKRACFYSYEYRFPYICLESLLKTDLTVCMTVYFCILLHSLCFFLLKPMILF